MKFQVHNCFWEIGVDPFNDGEGYDKECKRLGLPTPMDELEIEIEYELEDEDCPSEDEMLEIDTILSEELYSQYGEEQIEFGWNVLYE